VNQGQGVAGAMRGGVPTILRGRGSVGEVPLRPAADTLDGSMSRSGPHLRSGRRGPVLVLVTGFGSFEKVSENPSASITRALAVRPPPGVEVVPAVLPVSFARAPRAFDRSLARLRPRVPDLILGLGVMREKGFRLELRARGNSRGRARTDVDGRSASERVSSAGPTLRTPLESWLRRYAEAQGLRLSEYAGGYVCERLYHHLLVRSREIDRAGVFLHVPPARHTPVEEQIDVVRRFLVALTRGAGSRAL